MLHFEEQASPNPPPSRKVPFADDAAGGFTPDSTRSARQQGGPHTPSPATVSKSNNGGHPTPGTPFSRRSNVQRVLATFNEHLITETEDAGGEGLKTDNEKKRGRTRPISRCQVEVLTSGPEPGCRFMYNKVDKTVQAIEKRIRECAESLKKAGKTTAHLFQACQEEVLVVGRVCCDAEGLHSRLNDKAILLEGSVEYAGGERVRLDLRDVPSFSLFPGQVVGVEGKNPSGHCLVVSKIYDSISTPGVDDVAPPAELAPGGADVAGRGEEPMQVTWQKARATPRRAPEEKAFSMLLAAGPFTTSDNLSYEPLEALLSFARTKRPNVVLLIGPFIEREHPQIKSGTVNRTFKTIFQSEVRDRIEKYCEEMGENARVVMMPSTRDCQHDPVYPQPPLDSSDFEDPDHQITCLPNPSMFSCNGVTVGCNAMDVLHHMSSQEVSRTTPGGGGGGNDRMARLAGHLIGQKHFYPLFPPPPGTLLDLTLSPQSLTLPCVPDLLVLPSTLNHFVKVLAPTEAPLIDGNAPSTSSARSLCINPGRLAKGEGGGTFAYMQVVPPSAMSGSSPEETADRRQLLSSFVNRRTKVEIIRI